MKARLREGLTSRSRERWEKPDATLNRNREQRPVRLGGWLLMNPDQCSLRAPWPTPVQPGLRGEGVLLLTHRDPDAVVQGPFQLHQLVPPDLQLLPGNRRTAPSVAGWVDAVQPLHSEEVM